MKNYKATQVENENGKYKTVVCVDCDSHETKDGKCLVCGGGCEVLYLSIDAVYGYKDGRNETKRGFFTNPTEYENYYSHGWKVLYKLAEKDQNRRRDEMNAFLADRWA